MAFKIAQFPQLKPKTRQGILEKYEKFIDDAETPQENDKIVKVDRERLRRIMKGEVK